MARRLATNEDVLVGKHDDGREGAILTKIAQGRIIKVPMPKNLRQITDGTAGTVTRSNTIGTNPDGSNETIALQVTAGLTGYAAIEVTFWGRIFGVRFRRDNGADLVPFGAIIDGRIYKVGNPVNQSMTGPVGTPDMEALTIIADDLPNDGPHVARIHLGADGRTSGAITRRMVFYGFVFEADKGYNTYPNPGYLPASATVPTTSAAIASTISIANSLIRKIYLYNGDSATRTVTLYRSTTPIAVITLAAGATAVHDFGAAMLPTNLNWKVDAGTLVSGILQVEGAFA